MEPTRIDASELRRRIFDVLKRLPSDGPVDVLRNGRTVARLVSPAPETLAERPTIDQRRITRLCQRHHVRHLALFGSVLRDDFGPESDIDVLYEPLGRPYTLQRYMELHEALEAMFGRRVDLLAFKQVSDKSTRSRSILESARVVYGA
jgi:predicted nucleotidyltransferase